MSAALRQHRGQRAVFESSARYRVLVTGRRWGKTELDKSEAVAEFGQPGLVWYIAPTFDMARDLMWEPMRAWVPPEWLAKDPNETRMELDTIWGCRFACKSADQPDRLRGRGPRKIICDEFQDWQDGLKVWEEVLMPSLLTTKGRALFSGTPKSFNHLYVLFERGQSTDPKWADWRSWQFMTRDAPHITQEELERMRGQMDARAYRQEFEASFESLAGRAYYAFSRRDHVAPVELVPGVPVCVTFDFNVNPCTAVIGQRVGDEARVWREVWISHAGGEATRATAMRCRDLIRESGWVGPIRGYGDPAGKAAKTTGPSDHAVLRDVFPAAAWYIPKAAPHVRDRIEAVNARFRTMDGQTHCVIDPSCDRLIADLEQVVLRDDGELDKKSNAMLTHVSDAFGYWIHQEWPPVLRGGVAMGHAAWM